MPVLYHRAMELDFAACYKAIQSRDARFDGRFFTGVSSTGIYCRPICPAQTPMERNVRFYRSAAAAEAAGFRACRRCRPETSPGSPDWSTRSDLTGRALRLIAEGAVDTSGVDGLAHQLSVSERHLHRELVAAVGTGPLELARSRRAQTARLLLDETSMSVTDVAFAAGFASIRQFNESVQAAFGASPTELRQRARPDLESSGWLTLSLRYRPPLAAGPLLAFFARRMLPAIEEVTETRYRRAVALRETTGIIELEPVAGADHVLLRLRLVTLHDLGTLVQRCRRLFDLDAAPDAIGTVLSADPALAPLLTDQPGLRVPGAVDGWELAARTILGQQVSVAGARTIAGRLVAALGEPLAEPEGALTHVFPTPQAVAAADLTGLGLTRNRSAALRALAEGVAAGGITLDQRAEWEQTERALLAVPGVGPWTVAGIRMRALGDPDAFPASDLGVRQAMERLGLPPDLRNVTARAEAWRPWRAYAAMYLWDSLARSPSKEQP